ncbi:MAG: type III pantothenate kinase [Oscillospiraceae bacterium]|nr:type III pantothenate kinase [Oscillospiraceae bacterium]
MLLTVDISNTDITLGAFDPNGNGFHSRPRFTARIVTDRRRTSDQYACELMQLLALHRTAPEQIHHAMLCSVVPELTGVFQSAVKKLTGVTPLVLGPGVKTGLPIVIDNPAQLGADLVAGAVAARQLYPMPCAIFDLGTATTISVLDGQGKFRGGMICAGIAVTLESLASRTSLLPHVNVECPKTVIGTNTIHSMQSGAVNGTAAMIDGMLDRIAEELGEPVNAVATGGLASIVVPACRRPVTVCEHLMLMGLRMIYEKNRL